MAATISYPTRKNSFVIEQISFSQKETEKIYRLSLLMSDNLEGLLDFSYGFRDKAYERSSMSNGQLRPLVQRYFQGLTTKTE